MRGDYVLGAGPTGIAAGIASGCPIIEKQDHPGGLCATYKRYGYTFAYGGHWLFGVSPIIRRFLRNWCDLRRYERRAATYFSKGDRYVPYPIQAHIPTEKTGVEVVTFKDWLLSQFGPGACENFFYPFNDRYTAGLYDQIAPQDLYKSPKQGLGYNSAFYYPLTTLDDMFGAMSKDIVTYNEEIVGMHPGELCMSGGNSIPYTTVLSSIPLNVAASITGVEGAPDPHTSLLVLNIGGSPGKNFPGYHWLYVPDSELRFSRLSLYSNVRSHFAPIDKVCIAVERAYYDHKPVGDELQEYVQAVVSELQAWGYMRSVDVIDPAWIEVAYTWRWPGSQWREDTIAALADRGVYQIGRYGRWRFQGIVESIEDGLCMGAML